MSQPSRRIPECAPLGLAYLFAGRLNATFKVFLGYACLVISVGIGLTLSRGGVLATGVSVLVFLFWLLGYQIQGPGPRRTRWDDCIELLCCGAILLSQGSNPSHFKESPRTISMCVLVLSWHQWKDQPVFGVGPGQFDALFSLYRPRQVQERPGWMHSDYLQLLVEYGPLDLLFLSWVVFFLCWGPGNPEVCSQGG